MTTPKDETKTAGGPEAQTDPIDAAAGDQSQEGNNGDQEKNDSPETAAPSPDPVDPPGHDPGNASGALDPPTDPPDETDPKDPPDLPLAAVDPGAGDAGDTNEPEFRSKKTGKLLTGGALTQAKKKADKIRREAAIEAAKETQPGPSEALIAAQERKDEIIAKLHELDEEARKLEAEAQELRDVSAGLLLKLYPQQGPNDPHFVAVRGYLRAARMERQNRSLAPARLKALLQAAGRAPIDAAFARARGRGMARPKRAIKSAVPAGDVGSKTPGAQE